jgi:hypothetical protein
MMDTALDDACSTTARRAVVLAAKSAHKRLIVIGLLACLLSACCIGCGIGRPPALTLEQWEAQYRSTRSTGG